MIWRRNEQTEKETSESGKTEDGKADTLRVKAADITAALDSFTCTVTREGDEYVIHMEKRDEHGGDAETRG